MNVEIQLPEGIHAKIEKNVLEMKGPKGETRKLFRHPLLSLTLEGGMLKISPMDEHNERKKIKALLGTWESHINNMVKGVQKGWEAKMKIVYSHFPVRFSVEGR